MSWWDSDACLLLFFVELNMEFAVLIGLDGKVASVFDIWNMTWLLTRHLLGT